MQSIVMVFSKEGDKIMATIGLIIAWGLALIVAVVFGAMTGSVIVGIIVFVISGGFLYGTWIKESEPYNIQDIRDELKKKE